jgi:uncharacterized membrane protein
LNQRPQLDEQLQNWIDAGLIDEQARTRILAFEAGRDRRKVLQWPVLLAMVFGGILFAAGITLFVAAHWSELSPATRFSVVLLMVAVLHAGGAMLGTHFPVLSTTLHAIGTASLGAAIFLTGQIFNLHENLATGVLLWAVGAACGYVLLRTWSQAAMLALLAPTWLVSQWAITTEHRSGGTRLLAVGLILTVICYFSARTDDQQSAVRRSLVWIGGIGLLPCAGIAVAIAMSEGIRVRDQAEPVLPTSILVAAWTIALGAPLALAWFLRGRAAWINLLWALWAYLLVLAASYSQLFLDNRYHRSLGATLAVYALCAVGSAGLVAWGLHEKRKERLNLGIAGFAISVLFFYFDSFMGKLGRSASLLILGVLCLAGGYALETTRRRLVSRMEMNQ